MKQKLVAIFLIVVLSILVLPVVQVGALLFSNQLTEELQHTVEKNNTESNIGKSDFLQTEIHCCFENQSFKNTFYIHLSDGLPPNHSSDIILPPPNC